MSYKQSYTSKTTSLSQTFEDSKRKSSLLKDGSWIKKDVEEDEPVDRDSNYAKTVLGQYKSSETLEGSEPNAAKSPTSKSSPTTVHALTKRFSTSQDELSKSSTLPGRVSYTRSTSQQKSEAPKTTSTTTLTQDGKKTTETTITTTQSLSRSSAKTSTKTDTFKERVFSDKGSTYSPYTLPTKSTRVTETNEVKVAGNKTSEDQLFDTLIPSSMKDVYTTPDSKTSVSKTETVTVKTSMEGDGMKTTTTTRTSSASDDGLYSTFLPKSRYGRYSPNSTTNITKGEVVKVEISKGDGVTTTTTTRSTSKTEDDLYDTLLPKSMTSGLSSPSRITSKEFDTVDSSRGDDSPTSIRTIKSFSSYSSSDETPSTRTSSYTVSTKARDDYTSPRRSYSSTPDSSYEYTSVTSPTVYSPTSYKDSRAEDPLKDLFASKSSFKSIYSTPERVVLEKDLCSYCRKPFTTEAKMVLDDMKINCHASCFKCEECNSSLGHLRAGDTMWIHRRKVQCESCFSVTREQWRR